MPKGTQKLEFEIGGMHVSGQVARSNVDGGVQLLVAALLSGPPPGDFDYAGELKDRLWATIKDWATKTAAAEAAGVRRPKKG